MNQYVRTFRLFFLSQVHIYSLKFKLNYTLKKINEVQYYFRTKGAVCF